MQARFSTADIAMVCHGMGYGLDLATGHDPVSWPDISTAAKAKVISRVETYLRSPASEQGLDALARVEADLFMLIVGRMAAELR